ncbi:hypothetical protein QM201_00995 [Enterobacter asburiae]|nr:hypothetical protein [Enterobacter asburiae]
MVSFDHDVSLPFSPPGTAFALLMKGAFRFGIKPDNRDWQFVVTRSDIICSLITTALRHKRDLLLANEKRI